MKKKEIIIYSIIGALLLIFIGFKKYKEYQHKQNKDKVEESLVATPDYDENGYYVENTDNRFKKFNLFNKSNNEDKQKGGEENKLLPNNGNSANNTNNSEDGYNIFSGLGGNGNSDNSTSQSSSSLGSSASGNTKTDSSAVDIFGFAVNNDKNSSSEGSIANNQNSIKGNKCPCCGRVLPAKNKKQNVKRKGNRSTYALNFGDKKKTTKRKQKTRKKKRQEVAFNTTVIPLDSTFFDSDTIQNNEEQALVSMFFDGEFFGSQTVQVDRSIQVKSKESIETPNYSFPSGTIFYGNVKQSGRRFTCTFHRALYNYADYPIEFEIELYDATYSEGLLILDYEDEIKDENTDELITDNAKLAEEIALTRSITSSLINTSEKTVKAMKKKKMYSLDLEDGHEVLLSVKVPRDWFYKYVDKKDRKYRY